MRHPPAEEAPAQGGAAARRREGPGLRLLRHWHRLRQALARWRRLDRKEIEYRLAEAENAVRTLDRTQRAVAAELRRGAPPARLISPQELAVDDRFVLEDRCRALADPVYLGDHTALCRILGLYKIYLDTTDTGFASHLLLDGFWEMWLTIYLSRHLRAGMTAIDVGANFGYYTLLFGSLVGPQGRVYAVEPNPAAAAKLRRSVELNGLAARTSVIEAAAGAADGETDLFAPHGEPKNATIRFAADAATTAAGTVYRVAQATADRFAAESPRIDLVKIDCEGAEEAVIAGMTTILTRDKPLLILEFNAARYPEPGRFLDRLLALYGAVRYVDFDCDAHLVARDEVLRRNWGEDWLLAFGHPAALLAPAAGGAVIAR